MEKNKELLADLETARSKVTTVQKLAKKDACLLRKTKKEKETSQAEARCLAEEKATIVAKQENVEKETIQLKWKL